MKATVDRNSCTGCALCVDACPEVFEMGTDGVAVVTMDPIPPEEEPACRDAADQCPAAAIRIEE